VKAKARSSILTHKSVARTASSAAEQLHYVRPKKDSVCSDSKKKWVFWWASNYASPGLTVLGSRRPGPPAPAATRPRLTTNDTVVPENRIFELVYYLSLGD
jgi:hypothetical protein